MVIVNTIPFELTEIQKSKWEWQMKQKLALADLEAMKDFLKRELSDNLPVTFLEDIILTVSVNKWTMKLKIDYSMIKSKKVLSLIKLWLKGDMKRFSRLWLGIYK